VDINGDGFEDIFSGSYSRMDGDMAGTFQVMWGSDDGSFAKPETLAGSDDEPLIIPASEQNMVEKICTRPTAVDWDGDGDLDLVVGNFGGTFYLFKGEGSGAFNAVPEQLMVGEEPLALSEMHSDPFIVDWDGDGDYDLLSGSAEGGVYWSENTADAGSLPVLSDFVTLVGPAGYDNSEGLTPLGPAGATRIWVADYNADGKLDLIVGDSANLRAPVEGVSVEEMANLEAQWQEKMEAIFEKFETVDQEDPEGEAYQALMAEYEAHYAARAEFITEESTGFVWLLLQQ